jgi:hypothetical protein
MMIARSANWLETFASIFAAHPKVADAFCCVKAGEHDRTVALFQTTFAGDRMLHDARHVRGLGAGIEVRPNMMEEIGGCDPMLGSRFPDCNDLDMPYARPLRATKSITRRRLP